MRTTVAIAMTIPAVTLDAAASTQSPQLAIATVQVLRRQSCRTLSVSGPAKTVPSIGGTVGQRAGALFGEACTAALKARTDSVWDRPTLERWLTRPASLMPGNEMTFAGLPNAAGRGDLIADYKVSP